MQNIFSIIKVLVSLSLLILLGFVIKKCKLITDESTRSMNKVVFNVFLPALVFYNLYQAEVERILNWSVISYAAVFTILIFGLSLLLVPVIENENSKRSVLIHGIFRSNAVLLGLPIVTELFGADGRSLMTLIISVITPLYNILAVLCFEIFHKQQFNLKRAAFSILKNPLIIASVLGLGTLFLGIDLPNIFDKFLFDVAKIATPLALILLGGYFEIRHSERRLIIFGLFGRLILAPAICLAGSLLLGFRDLELITLMIVSCTPVAVSSFSMAWELHGDAALASDFFIYSTIVSAFTIPGWIILVQKMSIV